MIEMIKHLISAAHCLMNLASAVTSRRDDSYIYQYTDKTSNGHNGLTAYSILGTIQHRTCEVCLTQQRHLQTEFSSVYLCTQ